MFRKSRLAALALAIVMLFSACAFAEDETAYLSLSDPYFTDGTNVYDFTGLTAQFKLSASEALTQILASVITQAGTVNGAVEFSGETFSLYADGFTSAYTLTIQEMLSLIASATGAAIDVNALSAENFNLSGIEAPVAAESMPSLAETINGVHMLLCGDAGALATAETVTVDTISYEGLEAYAAPFEFTDEMVDAVLASIVQEIEATDEYKEFLAQFLAEIPADQMEGVPTSLTEAFETYVKPMQISMAGTVYYGADIALASNVPYPVFMDIAVNVNGTESPIQMEVTNGAQPSLYVVTSGTADETGNAGVVYLSMEANGEEYASYVEFGVTMNETPMMQLVYAKSLNAETGADVYQLYFNLAQDESTQYEVSFIYSSDENTFRVINISANIAGMQAELNYESAVSKAEGAYNEAGTLTLTTNLGISGHIGIAFGAGAYDAASIIPADGSVPAVSIASATEEQQAQLSVDAQTLLSTVMVNLMMGVPGFAALMQAQSAQG